jgi:hypothetical protein
MTIETKLDFKRYLKLMYTLTYLKPMMIFLTIVGLIMFIGSLFYFVGFNIPFDTPPFFQIVFGFFIIALLPFSIYRGAKKNFSSHGRLQEKIIYEFTDEKIKVIGETFNSEMDWLKTHKIVELTDWILIYQNRQIANILPKESFGDDLNEFKNMVKSKNIKTKFKK